MTYRRLFQCRWTLLVVFSSVTFDQLGLFSRINVRTDPSDYEDQSRQSETKTREPSVGTWLTLPDPIAARLMAQAGFDWLTVELSTRRQPRNGCHQFCRH